MVRRSEHQTQKGQVVRNIGDWVIYQAASSDIFISVYHRHPKGWGMIYSHGRCDKCHEMPPMQLLEDFLLLTMGNPTRVMDNVRDRIKEFLTRRKEGKW